MFLRLLPLILTFVAKKLRTQQKTKKTQAGRNAAAVTPPAPTRGRRSR